MILDIARSETRFVNRERMGIPIDEFAPLPKNENGGLLVDETGAIPPPPGPYGLDYRDEANLPIFWSMSALTTWPVLPMVFEVAEAYGLWESELFQPFLEIRDAVGTLAFAQIAAQALPHAGLLAAQRRGQHLQLPHHRLSAVERAGLPQGIARQPVPLVAGDARLARAGLHHAPRHGAAPDARLERRRRARFLDGHRVPAAHRAARERRDPSVRAAIRGDRGGAVPRAHALRALHPRVLPAGPFRRGRARRQLDLRRKGTGYIALYSWRPAEFVDHGPNVAKKGMTLPFDLVANGGPDNVWIVECGSESEWGSFAAFQAAVRDAAVTVTPVTTGLPPRTRAPFFEVAYESPSQGTLEFSWTGPLVVRGDEVPITDYPRMENPWTRVEFQDRDLFLENWANGTALWQVFDSPRRITFRVE